jgi:hypothetical protein
MIKAYAGQRYKQPPLHEDSAKSSFQKGIEICDQCDNQLTKAAIYYEFGSISHKRYEEKKALDHMQKAVEIYEALGVDKEVRRIRNEIWAIAA